MMHGCTHVNTLFLLLLPSAMNTTLPTYIEHKYKYLKCITNYIQTHANASFTRYGHLPNGSSAKCERMKIYIHTKACTDKHRRTLRQQIGASLSLFVQALPALPTPQIGVGGRGGSL